MQWALLRARIILDEWELSLAVTDSDCLFLFNLLHLIKWMCNKDSIWFSQNCLSWGKMGKEASFKSSMLGLSSSQPWAVCNSPVCYESFTEVFPCRWPVVALHHLPCWNTYLWAYLPFFFFLLQQPFLWLCFVPSLHNLKVSAVFKSPWR